MKYWTLQRRFVLDLIDNKQCYQPDFSKSEYLAFNRNLTGLYDLILNAFNNVNKIKLSGIVFSFATIKNEEIVGISNVDRFKKFFETKYKEGVLDTLYKHYVPEDMVILELEYDDNFNPIFLDYNDFQFLSKPNIDASKLNYIGNTKKVYANLFEII